MYLYINQLLIVLLTKHSFVYVYNVDIKNNKLIHNIDSIAYFYGLCS